MIREQCSELQRARVIERAYHKVPSEIIHSLRTQLSKQHARVKDVWDVCRRKKLPGELVDGLLAPHHFQQGLASLGYKLSATESSTLFNYLDENSDGKVSLEELYRGLMSHRSVAPDDRRVSHLINDDSTERGRGRRTPRTRLQTLVQQLPPEHIPHTPHPPHTRDAPLRPQKIKDNSKFQPEKKKKKNSKSIASSTR